MPFPHPQLERYAKAIAEQLQPHCQRIEIAGSIRRGVTWCNDIDLVVIPNNLEGLRERMWRKAEKVLDGPSNIIGRLYSPTMDEYIQIDVFIAHAGEADLLGKTPSNWGSILLLRTGSKEHNIKLTQRAQSIGLKWETQRGLVDREGNIVASETESNIFSALNLPFLQPPDRK